MEELFQRGSATATASIRRMKVGAFEGVVGTMLHFYVDGALGFKISPIVVLAMSIGFIASFLHPSCDGQVLFSSANMLKGYYKARSWVHLLDICLFST